jgi:hypothetical protein
VCSIGPLAVLAEDYGACSIRYQAIELLLELGHSLNRQPVYPLLSVEHSWNYGAMKTQRESRRACR